MEGAKRRCGAIRLAGLVPAVFLSWFLVSLFSTIAVFAASNIFKIQNVELSELSGYAEGEIGTFDETDISSNVTFHKLNDSAKYKISLKNTDSKDHEIESISVESSNENVSYEFDSYEHTTVGAGDVLDFVATAKYATAVEDIESRSQLVEAKIIIKYDDDENKESEEEIVINPTDSEGGETPANPSTRDEIVRSIIVLTVSALAFITVTIAAIKGHKKAYKIVTVFAVVACAASVASVVNAATIEVESFTLATAIDFNDRLVVTYDLDGEVSRVVVPFGETLESLPEIPAKEDYKTDGWLDEEGNPFDITKPITGDIKLTASYEFVDPFPVVWSQSGTCDFAAYKDDNKSHGRVSGDECAEYAGKEFIDTGIALYNAENIHKDYLVSFTVNHFDPNEQLELNQETIFTDKGYNWKSGVVYRLETNGKLNILSRKGDGNANKEEQSFAPSDGQRVSIMRYNSDLYYSVDGSAYVLLQEEVDDIEHDSFDIAAWFGAAPNDDEGTVQKRFITGSLSDMQIRLGENKDADLVEVTFDANGGSLSHNRYFVQKGQAIGTLPVATRSQQALIGWFGAEDQQISAEVIINEPASYKAKWISNVEAAFIANGEIEMAVDDTDQIRISNQSSIEAVSYSSADDSIATVDAETGVVTGTGAGETDIVITGVLSGKTKTVHVIVHAERLMVHFDAGEGSAVEDASVFPGSAIGTLPRTSREGYTFLGWFDEYGDELTDETIINDNNLTYFARWDEGAADVVMVCKKAEELHIETCDGSGHCGKTGYSNGAEITYGTLPGSGAPRVGDAYDCDVNGDNKYSANTERFYYVGQNGNNAVLVSHSNFEGTIQQNKNIFAFEDISAQLPSASKWGNEKLVQFDGKPARILSVAELEDACGGSNTTGSLDGCEFLLENTKYASDDNGRTGLWLSSDSNTHYRIFVTDRAIRSVSNTSNNAVRPAIEVPLEYVQQGDDIYVNFVFGDGRQDIQRQVGPGEIIGDLPIVSNKDHARFLGWYTAAEGGERISKYTIPSGDGVEYYGHWDIDTYTVQFNTHGGSAVESVTREYDEVLGEFSSSRDNYDFDGWYTGENGAGTKYESTTKITSDVTLHAKWKEKTYEVSFETHGGSAVATVQRNYGQALGEINSTKEHYHLLGWYTGENGAGTKYEADTTITSNVTLHAYWGIDRVTVSFDAQSGVAVGAIELDYGSTISELPETHRNNYIFGGWFTETGGNGSQLETSTVIEGDITYYAKWTFDTMPIVWEQTGACTFTTISGANNTYSGSVSGDECQAYAGEQFIDTGISLYSAANIDKDFEIYFEIEHYEPSEQVDQVEDGSAKKQQTFMNAKDPTVSTGVVIRRASGNSNKNIETNSNNGGSGTSGNSSTLYSNVEKIKVVRENGKIKYSYNDAELTQLQDVSSIAASKRFDLAVWFGAYPDKKTTDPVHGYAPKRFINATFKNMYIKLERSESNGSDEIVEFDASNPALVGYYDTIGAMLPQATTFNKNTTSINNSTWGVSESDFVSSYKSNFESHGCKIPSYSDSAYAGWASGSTDCSKPLIYDTSTSSALNVWLFDEANSGRGQKVGYTQSTNGTISNMVPGRTYYWEKADDGSTYGYVKAVAASGNRRLIDAGSVRNVRDLGGLSATYRDVDDAVKTGTVKYEKLFRGERLWTNQNDLDLIAALGVDKEYALVESDSDTWRNDLKLGDVTQRDLIHYDFNYGSSNYNIARQTVSEVMQDVVSGKDIYFHCRVGADRTGTMAYLLEGLLGVPDEERYEDYELTYLSGLTDRTRYYKQKSSTNNKKFVYMMDYVLTNQDIYDWFMAGTTNEAADKALIQDFRDAMIDYN